MRVEAAARPAEDLLTRFVNSALDAPCTVRTTGGERPFERSRNWAHFSSPGAEFALSCFEPCHPLATVLASPVRTAAVLVSSGLFAEEKISLSREFRAASPLSARSFEITGPYGPCVVHFASLDRPPIMRSGAKPPSPAGMVSPAIRLGALRISLCDLLRIRSGDRLIFEPGERIDGTLELAGAALAKVSLELTPESTAVTIEDLLY